MFDPATAPNVEPETAIQTTFIHWKIADNVSSDYANFRYSYSFKLGGDKSAKEYIIPVDATGYSSGSVNWPIGEYYWRLNFIRLSDNAKVFVRSGKLRMLPDASSGVDMRPHAAIMVAKIEALLEGRADSDIASYTIAGRQISKMSVPELMRWRDIYRAEVASQDAKSNLLGNKPGNNVVRIRFV